MSDWRKFAGAGHVIGRADAPITILEFADFECPVCGRFEGGALKSIRREYPQEVRVVYRHWPLSYHKFAYPAARAAECAASQGRFDRFHDLVFAEQDSLGVKSFEEFGIESGVADSVAFHVCLHRSDKDPAIESDIAAALAIGGRGTPTVVVNGTMFTSAPDSAALDAVIRSALQQKR